MPLESAQSKAVEINVHVLVDERKQVRNLVAIPPAVHERSATAWLVAGLPDASR